MSRAAALTNDNGETTMFRQRKRRPEQERPEPVFHGSGRHSYHERQQTQPQRRQENQPIDERTYGNIWTRVWENIGARGEPYLTVSQHRLYEQNGQTGITKSLHIDDAEDAIRGMQWAIGFVTQGDELTEQRGDDERERRMENVRRVKQIARGVR